MISVCRSVDPAGREGMTAGSSAARHVARQWHIIDADGQVLGRVATRAARLLQGKHKASWVPYRDTGDHVVIINAARVKLTGRKEEQKLYRTHSGYEGGLREERAAIVRQKQPVRLVEEAVRGMLPKTKLGEAMYRKLKVYAAGDHPHAAQKPVRIEVA
jgi:large subunit ribosomal protein L13